MKDFGAYAQSCRRFVATMLSLLVASTAAAAPFCVTAPGLPTECLYYDTQECSARAAQLSGVCLANPNEIKLVPGSGRYCMVDSNRVALCAYPDRDSCSNDAARNGAVCVEAPETGTQPSPFRNNPEQRY